MDWLANPYVAAAVIAALAVAVWKIFDQWRDNRQKKAQEIADKADELGLLDFPAILKAYARDDHEEMIVRIRALGEKLSAPDGVIDVLCTVYERTFEKVLATDIGKVRVRPLILKRLLGFILDDATQAALGPVAGKMQQYGMKDSAALTYALAANNIDAARNALHALVEKFRDPEGIDEVLMSVAEKAVPELLKDPIHAEALKRLVNGPPSLEEQKAALEKQIAAQKVAVA